MAALVGAADAAGVAAHAEGIACLSGEEVAEALGAGATGTK